MTENVSETEIGVTGNFWMGRGIESIWSLVTKTFEKADDEIQIAAYVISENSEEFFDLLESTLIRGIRVLVIVNRFSSYPENVKNLLLYLTKKYNNFILKDFTPIDRREDLHAKIIVVDHSIALIGSANLTWKGMVANHEIMIRLSGKVAYSVGELLDRLSVNSRKVTIESLEKG